MFKEISEISIPTAGLSLPTSSSTYTQTFTYDQIIPGNLVKKTSTENSRNTPDSLNYDLDYTYAPGFVHRVERAGDKNFVYDLSGNLILEYDGEKQENPEEDDYVIINQENNVYGTEGAWGYGSNRNGGDIPNYTNKRKYEWDDRNQLIRTVDNLYDTNYVYNNEGQRVAKYTSNSNALSETLYFNNFWTWHYDTANAYTSYGQYSKNIYLGETRIVTRLLTEETNSVLEPERTYYYHTDHLGSASLVTNSEGKVYERLEYTPYGEVWVDITANTGTLSLYLPYKFSAKEKDSETGLYYYGARYLDPKYSLWKSADPALAEYIPIASTNDEWSKKNSNLPGMGGLFNPTNFHLYHYAGNNPINYTDPDGRDDVWMAWEWITMYGSDIRFANFGITGMRGKANVTFTNLTTNQSYTQNYDIISNSSFGLNAFVGVTGGFTIYYKSFPDNTSPGTVFDSYRGIFASFPNPFLSSAMNFLTSYIDVLGFSISTTMVVGLDNRKGLVLDEKPWIGINFSANFNLIDLFLPDGISVPTVSIQYSVYKLPWESWDKPYFQEAFKAAQDFAKTPIYLLPRIDLANMYTELQQ